MMRPLIGFVPHDSGSNAYARRMQEIIAPCGHLERFELRACLRACAQGRARRFDIVIFNWLENRLISRDTRRVSWRGVLRLMLQMLLIRLFVRRIVFIRHNLWPHRTAPGSAALARTLVDCLERCCHVVFVHSGDELALGSGRRARHYLPHPLYSRVPAADTRATAALGLPECYFLIFGRIVPYKKIEQLLGKWPADAALVICGEIGDVAYDRQLATLAQAHDNIFYRPGLLSEAQAQALVAGATAVVLAHAEPNTLVSGSFFYALSLHRRVLALRTPFAEWVGRRLGEHVVAVAADVDELCARAGAWRAGSLDDEDEQRLQQEFGDAAIRRVLAATLPLTSVIDRRAGNAEHSSHAQQDS